jgi:transmembrane sensor
MKEETKKQIKGCSNKATMIAAKWIARLNADEMELKDWIDLDKWLSEHPSHQREFDLLNAIWERSGDLADHPLVIAKVNERPIRTKKINFRNRLWDLFPDTPNFRPIVAMAAAVLVIVAVWIVKSNILFPNAFSTIYQTQKGDQRTVILADGSSVILDTNTKISTNISADLRSVTLIAGRALFSVKHDQQRFFTVRIGDVTVRVLGTEFDVFKRENGNVTVDVLKGAVSISKKPIDPKSLLVRENSENSVALKSSSEIIKKSNALVEIVTSGKGVIVHEKKQIMEEHKVDVERITSWRSGKLDFNMAYLDDVVNEVNRYLDYQLVIGDDDLKNMRLSLICKISDSKYFLRALKKILPITSKYLSNRKIILLKK